MKPQFKLYLITDSTLDPPPHFAAVEKALAAGVRTVQLRDKIASSRNLLESAERLNRLASQYGANLFINDRIDVAIVSGADGVHLPEEGIPVSSARRALPDGRIGGSVHSVERAVEAEKSGMDFVVFGPIFSTPSKAGILEPRGLQALGLVCKSVRIPVYAIGGINPENARECMARGAAGVAVIRGILQSKQIRQTVGEFRESLGGL